MLLARVLVAMKVAKARTWVNDHDRWEHVLEDPSDRRKFWYAVEQYEQYEAKPETCELEKNLHEAAVWIATHSVDEVNKQRKRMIEKLQEADSTQRATGAVDRWFG